MTPEYIAGVLDSDGSLSISRRRQNKKTPNFIIMIQITWLYNVNSLKFFKKLCKTYGGSYYIGKSHSGFNNPKPIIKYCAVGSAALYLINSCGKFLILKNKQSKNLRKLMNIKRTDNSISKQNKLYLKNAKLNGVKIYDSYTK